MIIKNFTIKNGDFNVDYSIVADSWETSQAWGHKASLVINNSFTASENKITYLNRTWESYQFQTVMKNILSEYADKLIQEDIVRYKTKHGIKRMSKEQKRDLMKENKEVQGLLKYYKTL